MDVAAFLNRQLLQHLTIVLGSQHVLHPAGGWDELQITVQQRTVDVVVVDPLADGATRLDVIERIRRQHPTVPIVIYTALSATSMHAIAHLGRIGVEHVVLSRFDDDRRRFLDLLERVPGQALSDRMLRALEPELAALPVTVVRAIRLMFRSPGRFRNTQDLSAASGLILRTLYRHLDAAGLPSPRLLVAAARLVRVYSLLRDPERHIKEVARRGGYHSQYQLAQHMRALTGYTPRVVRQTIEPSQFVALLADGLRRPRRTTPTRARDAGA